MLPFVGQSSSKSPACGISKCAGVVALVLLIGNVPNIFAQHITVIPNASLSFRAANTSTSLAIIPSRRWRRYVRFPPLTGSDAVVVPTGSSGRLVYPQSSRPPPGAHAGYNAWLPVRHKQPHFQVSGPTGAAHFTRLPQMGQRSPRLVFRDPDIPGTIHASSFYGHQDINGLQALATDDPREGRVPSAGGYPVVGDQSLCVTGTCEFFLFCWMSAGLIEGSCGGFLYTCCQRRAAKDTAKKGEHDENSVLVDYGPVTNDPSK